ncbi:aspartate/glutamate racemase family protein [Rhodobacteraceae bacterium N5(2021)]|uniref:Aspartate/glutamate racemase family protein n=1 Tax=Gymnodinialimonas phycosphaerae TaxID=2841589 RepID=A0A975YG82_9RHOB|nr:aspartate/glutamate racemase family protein [Gymnodinialimonas phycosphaerae]MBY4891349.1 aspartate/glutamate racemase family protein [Gymnodinialimonas phycosphaerae]
MDEKQNLYVINPNSSEAVTLGIQAAVAPLESMGRIICLTNPLGPKGIESQAQADQTIPQTLALAAQVEEQATAFVIACFGDPGLHALRDQTAKPVLGIQESAIMTALTLGQRFGIIAILPTSIPRHLRSIGAMGVQSRLAGDRALNLGVADLQDAGKTQERMIQVGRDLIEKDGADVLIMGCAGMARFRLPLEEALGVPVVEPCQAAVAMALPRIPLKQYHKVGDRHA